MMSSLTTGLRFLRPSPRIGGISPARKSAYLAFFYTARVLRSEADTEVKPNSVLDGRVKYRGDVRNRIQYLEEADALKYPRMQSSPLAISVKDFRSKYAGLTKLDKCDDVLVVRGRVIRIRSMSRTLTFIDLREDGLDVQVKLDLSKIVGQNTSAFESALRPCRKGDIVSVCGIPYRPLTQHRPLSIEATQNISLLTPALTTLYGEGKNSFNKSQTRHLIHLGNGHEAQTLRLRSALLLSLRVFFYTKSFVEVSTPLLSSSAGGALARPFLTTATEFQTRKLALRISPELWLKRLVIGGFDRVFEIGTVFRNEGVDSTHNPEFTTCEFYKSFTTLDELMEMTEELLSSLANATKHVVETELKQLAACAEIVCESLDKPYDKVEFIPTISAELGEPLPDLSSPTALEDTLALFQKHNIELPKNAEGTPPTLIRLLDKLCEVYIESKIQTPTFIIHHPAIMSPLAKSFFDPNTNQIVSARAELFISGMEIANMYEEENSPFEQRRKLEEQARVGIEHGDGESMHIDEAYLEVMENGLPPTGGWGVGVDRLVMLLSGSSRIHRVSSFGSLRDVVVGRGLGGGAHRSERSLKAVVEMVVDEGKGKGGEDGKEEEVETVEEKGQEKEGEVNEEGDGKGEEVTEGGEGKEGVEEFDEALDSLPGGGWRGEVYDKDG